MKAFLITYGGMYHHYCMPNPFNNKPMLVHRYLWADPEVTKTALKLAEFDWRSDIYHPDHTTLTPVRPDFIVLQDTAWLCFTNPDGESVSFYYDLIKNQQVQLTELGRVRFAKIALLLDHDPESPIPGRAEAILSQVAN